MIIVVDTTTVAATVSIISEYFELLHNVAVKGCK